jgi:hypothetical protein
MGADGLLLMVLRFSLNSFQDNVDYIGQLLNPLKNGPEGGFLRRGQGVEMARLILVSTKLSAAGHTSLFAMLRL